MVVVRRMPLLLKVNERVGDIIDKGIAQAGDELLGIYRRAAAASDPYADVSDGCVVKRPCEV